jgi:hypothetical protein
METPWLWQGGFLVYALATAAIILGSMQPSGPVRALLGAGPLPWLGKISYGVYIYHFAFYVTITHDWTGLAPWPLLLARVAATFAVAVPSYYLLELPIRRGRMFTGWRPWVAMPAGVVAVVTMLMVATLDAPETAPAPVDPLAQADAPQTGSGPQIMVVGGSIATNVGRGLYRWAHAEDRARVVNFALQGCGIARGGRPMNARKRISDECDDWPRRWRVGIQRFDPDVVVVLVSGWDTTERTFPAWGDEPREIGDPVFDEWLLSEYDAAIDLLSSRGARIVWLTAPCLAARDGGHGVWDPDRVHALNRVLARMASRRSDVVDLVDFGGRICPDGVFTNTLGGMTDIRPDGAHLSDEAADWVASWLGPRVVAHARAHETRS